MDHPDLRFELPLTTVSELARAGSFQVFHGALDGGGMVKGLRVPGLAGATRKETGRADRVRQDSSARRGW